jgi:hypothetical protein
MRLTGHKARMVKNLNAYRISVTKPEGEISLGRNRLKKTLALVREELCWPSLVGEVSANFSGLEGAAWSAQRIPMTAFEDF